jgi:chromosome partitioning protein
MPLAELSRHSDRTKRRNSVQIWTIANQKGGVGKTTSVVALAGLLTARKQRVLLVDLDPHGSLTSYFGYNPDRIDRGTLDLFGETLPERDSLQALLRPAGDSGIQLLGASPALATIERRSVGEGMGRRVARALAALADQFDYALIDTPPVLGALMINALAASDRLLIPTQTEFLAMKGLERMVRTLAMVERSLQQDLRWLIVPTLFDRRTQACVASLRALRIDYAERIWPAAIPIDTRFRDASRAGMLPHQYDARSRGVQAYAALLKQLLASDDQRLRA